MCNLWLNLNSSIIHSAQIYDQYFLTTENSHTHSTLFLGAGTMKNLEKKTKKGTTMESKNL